jgi:hypothetical protein
VKRFLGLLILVIAIAVVIWFQVRSSKSSAARQPEQAPANLTVVRGPVGGEKVGFLDDARVKEILASKYGMRVEYEKRGSIEMATGDVSGQDFLWPSSEFAAEEFRQTHTQLEGGTKSETIFNSPLVFYSWSIVVDALQQKGIVTRRDNTWYLTDAPAFVKLITSGARWKDIGLPQLYGRVTVFTTDPNRSNSGTMFAALLATLLNDGDVVDDAALAKHIGEVRQFFGRMGYMEGSSGDLFKQFLNTGVGANPIIVGYENQMIEYGLEHPEHLPVLQQSVRVIYPQPTMWSSHQMITLTANGRKLMESLKDREIVRLAWERHGFRSGFGGETGAAAARVVGVPSRIESVAPMPGRLVMEKLLAALRAEPHEQPATSTAR